MDKIKFDNIKFIAKQDTWFDEGTEAKLLFRMGDEDFNDKNGCGMFEGIKDGKIDEEPCGYDEFIIIIDG